MVAGFKAGQGAKANGIGWQEEIAPTLAGTPSGTNQVPAVCCGIPTERNGVVQSVAVFSRQRSDEFTGNTVVSTQSARQYKDATDLVVEQPVAIDRAFFNQGQNAQYEPQYYEDGTVHTLVARGPSGVAVRYIVRRLTPTECARLQGFPDLWGQPEYKEDFADEEWTFWAGVRNTHAAINGKATKSYTREQMVKWYNGLHTDSAEYKMWGNGIALPCARYVLEGIAEVCSWSIFYL